MTENKNNNDIKASSVAEALHVERNVGTGRSLRRLDSTIPAGDMEDAKFALNFLRHNKHILKFGEKEEKIEDDANKTIQEVLEEVMTEMDGVDELISDVEKKKKEEGKCEGKEECNQRNVRDEALDALKKFRDGWA